MIDQRLVQRDLSRKRNVRFANNDGIIQIKSEIGKIEKNLLLEKEGFFRQYERRIDHLQALAKNRNLGMIRSASKAHKNLLEAWSEYKFRINKAIQFLEDFKDSIGKKRMSFETQFNPPKEFIDIKKWWPTSNGVKGKVEELKKIYNKIKQIAKKWNISIEEKLLSNSIDLYYAALLSLLDGFSQYESQAQKDGWRWFYENGGSKPLPPEGVKIGNPNDWSTARHY